MQGKNKGGLKYGGDTGPFTSDQTPSSNWSYNVDTVTAFYCLFCFVLIYVMQGKNKAHRIHEAHLLANDVKQ